MFLVLVGVECWLLGSNVGSNALLTEVNGFCVLLVCSCLFLDTIYVGSRSDRFCSYFRYLK